MEINNQSEEFVIENTEVQEVNIVEEAEDSKIKVYITGEVKNPGVIEINEGERIEDAIQKAGGITEKANLSKVNLAYKLEDGQKVCIPNSDKDIEIVSTENGENVIEKPLQNGVSRKININNADESKLCEIPGVGEAMARKIIQYREDNGKFNSIEDLKNVNGIGDKKLEGMKDFITIK